MLRLGSFLGRRLAARIPRETLRLRAEAGALLARRRAPCPACGIGRLAPLPADPAARHCNNPACAAIVSLRELAGPREPMAMAAERLRTLGRRLTLGAELFVMGGAGLALATLSAWPLAGGAILALVTGAHALAAFYRVWQIDEGRLFETRAPFGDFARDRLRRLIQALSRRKGA